ncbi:hypothetical protein HPB50_009676 [Hyalomma asiaticum]|uniref:Uncharacterized protein n=1 Tax=Hyalomma asiaticum TaxID=266040 RepID=A0ACB7T725_HYAAI|nr:hypothetical protein HPB50_009676 [Hyalomma asiaticum]
MASKGPRVSVAQRDILIEFIEQHPYLARATTENQRLKPLSAGATTGQSSFMQRAGRRPARLQRERGGKVGGVDGRVLDVLSRTGAVVTDAPQFFEQSDERSPSRHHRPRHHPSQQRSHTSSLYHSSNPIIQPQPPSQPPSQPQPSSQPQPRQTPQPRAPQLPRRQLRDLEEVVQRTAEEYVRQGEAANARAQEEARFHQRLVELHRQYYEAQAASQQQLVEEVQQLRQVQQQRLEEDRLMRSLVERLLLHFMPAAAQGPPPPQ